MGIFKLFKLGVQTANKKARMLIYLWLTNILFSLIVVSPVYFLLQKDFSKSLLGDQIGEGMNLIWFGDIIFKYRDFYPSLIGVFIIPAVLFFLLYIYLNGGIIGRIAAQDVKVTLSNFFSDCGKYFFRFFRIFLISLIGYFVLFGVVMKLISALFTLWTKNASTGWPQIFSSNLKLLITVLLFSIVRMFFDYVRVRLVIEDSKKTIKATLTNFSFLGKRFFKVWLLYLLVGVVVVIFSVVYIGINQILPKAGLFFIIVFIWQQLYILSKIWTKMLFFSTEYHYAKKSITN